jgi:hypothetical protein
MQFSPFPLLSHYEVNLRSLRLIEMNVSTPDGMAIASVCNWLAVHPDNFALPFLLFPSVNVGYYPKLYHSATSVPSSTWQCPVDVHSAKLNKATSSFYMNLEKYF